MHSKNKKTSSYNNFSDVIAELVSNKEMCLIQLKKYLIGKALYSQEEYLNTQYRNRMIHSIYYLNLSPFETTKQQRPNTS